MYFVSEDLKENAADRNSVNKRYIYHDLFLLNMNCFLRTPENKNISINN